MSELAKFTIGQLVQHRLFAYRGVIYEVDPVFMLSEQWYQQMATSCPPKEEPWYHVLVDNAI
ncbi:DNA-binding protein, partial [Gammaproteobacteria bacterium 53_120_T64]